jgi:deoxyribonuclease V
MTPKEAIEKQKELVKKLQLLQLTKQPTYVAGADISYSKKDPRLFAALVVFKLPELEVVEEVCGEGEATFPYIPGLLGFREVPVLLPLFEMLSRLPDVVICDGQGVAHPRGLGYASHLGVVLGIPTVGCAKTRLVGEYEPVGEKRWSQSELLYKGNRVGTVLRTRESVKPVFVSPGHLIDQEGAVEIVKQCVGRYRLPESTRQAHKLVNAYRLEKL